MLWVFLIGYFFFNEIPTLSVYIGATIIAGAGLFVLLRERYLGIERQRTSAVEGPPVGRMDDMKGP
jgi:drug/metabolite transporter (DMT)-like permease